MSDCQDCNRSAVNRFVGRESWREARLVGATGPVGPTGVVQDMAAPTGPYKAIVEGGNCASCGFPILEITATFGAGSVNLPVRQGQVKGWTHANKDLSKGAWVKCFVPPIFPRPNPMNYQYAQFSLAFSAFNPSGVVASESSNFVAQERMSFDGRSVLNSNINAGPLCVSLGSGEATHLEFWEAITAYQNANQSGAGNATRSFSKKVLIAADNVFWSIKSEFVKVCVVVDDEAISLIDDASSFRIVHFSAKAPATHFWDGMFLPGSALLHTAIEVDPPNFSLPQGVTYLGGPLQIAPGRSLTGLPVDVATWQNNGNERTLARFPPGPTGVTGPTGPSAPQEQVTPKEFVSVPPPASCSTLDGPWWHELAIVQAESPLAVSETLHQITVKFLPGQHPGNDWNNGGFPNFTLNPQFSMGLLANVNPYEPFVLRPKIGNRRLLPCRYASGPIQFSPKTYSTVNVGGDVYGQGRTISPIVHAWSSTYFNQENARLVIAFECWLKVFYYFLDPVLAGLGNPSQFNYTRHLYCGLHGLKADITPDQCAQLSLGTEIDLVFDQQGGLNSDDFEGASGLEQLLWEGVEGVFLDEVNARISISIPANP